MKKRASIYDIATRAGVSVVLPVSQPIIGIVTIFTITESYFATPRLFSLPKN